MLTFNTMEAVRVISTTTIRQPNHNNDISVQKIDLTPWDLQFLHIGSIQRGLLFRNEKHTENQIEHLQHSLSSILAFFPLLAGRLTILQHNDNSVSSHIVCNNAGALFVHAVAPNTTVADILRPKYVPPIVHSFFPLNGVKNYEGTSQPLLAVQVTELLDGVFIAFTINHVVADGKSLWHFVNSWAEISRGSIKISKFPSLERCFLDGVDHPVRFPFTTEEEKHSQNLKPQTRPVRVFHFTKEKIADMKSKANVEANTDKISSLQALLTHIWRSVIRCKYVESNEDIHYMMPVGVRPRMVPALPEDYFGNAALIGRVSMKAGELLQEGGVGKGALEINKMISLNSHEKVKNHYEAWVRTPRLVMLQSCVADDRVLCVGSSPRFDIYGNDFGWGKPVAVRSGGDFNGMVTLFAGAEEGSIDIEVFLSYEILEAMGNDPEFMHICHSE